MPLPTISCHLRRTEMIEFEELARASGQTRSALLGEIAVRYINNGGELAEGPDTEIDHDTKINLLRDWANNLSYQAYRELGLKLGFEERILADSAGQQGELNDDALANYAADWAAGLTLEAYTELGKKLGYLEDAVPAEVAAAAAAAVAAVAPGQGDQEEAEEEDADDEDAETIEFEDPGTGESHDYVLRSSKKGMVSPETAVIDLILGNKYIDLASPVPEDEDSDED